MCQSDISRQDDHIFGAVADIVGSNRGGQRFTAATALLAAGAAIIFWIVELSTSPVMDLPMLAPAVPFVTCAGPAFTRTILRARLWRNLAGAIMEAIVPIRSVALALLDTLCARATEK